MSNFANVDLKNNVFERTYEQYMLKIFVKINILKSQKCIETKNQRATTIPWMRWTFALGVAKYSEVVTET